MRFLNAKSTEKAIRAAALAVVLERPVVVEVLERPFEIIDADLRRPPLLDARAEGLAQALEADDHVRDHRRVAVGAHAHRGHPGQELGIAAHVRHEIEHLGGAVGQPASLLVAGHQAFASLASRAARIFAKSSPAW